MFSVCLERSSPECNTYFRILLPLLHKVGSNTLAMGSIEHSTKNAGPSIELEELSKDADKSLSVIKMSLFCFQYLFDGAHCAISLRHGALLWRQSESKRTTPTVA